MEASEVLGNRIEGVEREEFITLEVDSEPGSITLYADGQSPRRTR